MELPVYYPRANGLAERASLTLRRDFQAWCPNLNWSFGEFLQRALLKHPKTSKTKEKTPVEILLGRRVGLPSIADFDSRKPLFFELAKISFKSK